VLVISGEEMLPATVRVSNLPENVTTLQLAEQFGIINVSTIFC